ncbi:hypothetical protein DERP_003912 [Dermatophagoides pteronyssinus]|uniref:Uncharacterized protein n=1 Tax=Dermatophagoides pteronyssinus TaxID=6956 RepID=A0ABQ8J895_DERPT|nr:hypothetical protein DERP_003912 [Dermatophagoides pteronyssinus]
MANNNDTNLYNILGCNEDATIDDIRKNYKKLALQCHPDKRNQQQSTNDDNDDVGQTIRPEFSQLNQAATILSDKHSKFCYDSTLLAKKLPETIINDEINRQDFYKDDNGNLVYDCRCGGHFRIIDSYRSSQSTSSSQSMIIIDCDCCSLSIKYPQRQSLCETFMKNSVQQRLYKLHGRCLCLTLLIYGIISLIFYMQLDNWRQTLIKLNVNGKRIQYVLDYIDQMRQAKPIVWWKAASYHYIRCYNQSTCQMVNTRTLSANEIRSNHITQQRQRLGRKRIDTRYSNARFHYEDRFNIEDISDRLIDIDRSPITRIRFFKGFVFIDKQSAQEFDRQRTNFFHHNFKLDDYLEIREGIDLDGIDFYDSIITLSTDNNNGLLNWHWYCRPSMFWIFSAILLSWPFRIILEYNTSYVNYRVVKLFSLLNNINQSTIMNIPNQQHSQSCHQRSQSIDNNLSLSNYLIAPSYSEAILTCSDNFAQGLNNVPTTMMMDDSNSMKTIEMPLTIDLPSYDEIE